MNRRFRPVSVALALCFATICFPDALVHSAVQDVRFDVNDVSYMWPVPKAAADVADLISGDDAIAGGTSRIWPKAAFDTVIATAPTISVLTSAGTAQSVTLPEESFNNPHNWKVVGFRVDPCAPGCDEAVTLRLGQTPQIRLVLQPVIVNADGSIKVHDFAAHLAFSFTTGPVPIPGIPDRPAFIQIVNDLKALKLAAETGGASTTGALRVHPALSGKVPGFAGKVKAFLQARLAEDRLFAVAFMGLAPRPEPWVFFAMVKGPAGKLQLAPQRQLGGNAAQMLTFRGGDHVMPTPVTSNVTAASGVSTADLFRDDISSTLDTPVLAGANRPLRRDIPDLIANPRRSHLFNTDCVSCHTETTRRRLLKIQSADQMFGFTRPTGTSAVDEGVLPSDDWNVRNFGWFQDGVTIFATVSHRTGNEAAESADQINKQYLSAVVPAVQIRRDPMPEPVANPLTLVMKIKSQKDFQELKALIDKLQSLPPEQNPIVVALNRLGTVHFARFVFIEERLLAVITTYDGSFDAYIDAFIDAIGQVFDQLLAHIDGAPPLPVSKNRAVFLDFVRKNDLKAIPPFYSAYPNLKTFDILTLQKKAGGQ